MRSGFQEGSVLYEQDTHPDSLAQKLYTKIQIFTIPNDRGD
jgi:hypothetical protein